MNHTEAQQAVLDALLRLLDEAPDKWEIQPEMTSVEYHGVGRLVARGSFVDVLIYGAFTLNSFHLADRIRLAARSASLGQFPLSHLMQKSAARVELYLKLT